MLLVTRIAVVFGIIGLFVSGVFCYWLAGVTLEEVYSGLVHNEVSSAMALEVISAIDKLFLGTGVFIMALGISSLAIAPVPLPSALQFHDFHHLKSFFCSFLIVVMAIIFLENLALMEEMIHEPNSTGSEILYTGIAFLLATIALLLFQKSEVIFASKGGKAH
jgi:uncharacterized membrane protein YqhA